MSIEDLARASDIVVLGRVEHVEVVPHGPAGQPGIHSRVLIQVAETLRGEHQPFVEVWAHGGRLGNRMRVVPGQATFRPGEDIVLFAFTASGALWPTGMGRGKWTTTLLSPNPDVAPQLHARHHLIDGWRISLDELRARVAAVHAERL